MFRMLPRPRSTPHQPLPSIGHTREALGDLPLTLEEEEEQQHRAAGELWENEEVAKDGEAGGGHSHSEMTHDDHPSYPTLHDPLAPLPAPTRVSHTH